MKRTSHLFQHAQVSTGGNQLPVLLEKMDVISTFGSPDWREHGKRLLGGAEELVHS